MDREGWRRPTDALSTCVLALGEFMGKEALNPEPGPKYHYPP